MATCQAVAEILDETLNALVLLDLNALHDLEERAAGLAKAEFTGDGNNIRSLLAKRRVLELVLDESASSLNVLYRLFGRDMREPWER